MTYLIKWLQNEFLGTQLPRITFRVPRTNTNPRGTNIWVFNNIFRIKANSKTVYRDLCGGSNGHLDLILSTAKFIVITLKPFIWRLHPGILVITTGTIQLIVTAIKKKKKNLFVPSKRSFMLRLTFDSKSSQPLTQITSLLLEISIITPPGKQ